MLREQETPLFLLKIAPIPLLIIDLRGETTMNTSWKNFPEPPQIRQARTRSFAYATHVRCPDSPDTIPVRRKYLENAIFQK